jgi:hypothetical protein
MDTVKVVIDFVGWFCCSVAKLCVADNRRTYVHTSKDSPFVTLTPDLNNNNEYSFSSN